MNTPLSTQYRRLPSTRQLSLLAAAVSLLVAFASMVASSANAPYQGFGASTPGGAGKPIVRVTNLNDSGAGSLRTALSGGNRTVVFDVAGDIIMRDEINIQGSFITLDGFTAPPPGITLRNFGLRILGSNGAHDVIARGIRIRDAAQDGVWVADGAYNIVIDHFSVYNSFDGNIDITRAGTRDVTVQWTILAKPMGEEKNMLLAFKHSRVTLHHNLFIESAQRNPQSTYDDTDARTMDPGTTLDMRNNLIWNWRGGYGSRIRFGTKANVVQNFYAAAGGDAKDALIVCKGLTTESQCYNDPRNIARAYVNGNFSADSVALNSRGTESAPFEFAPVDIQDACVAAHQVLADAGVRPLDLIDQQILGRVSLPVCIGALPARLDFVSAGGENPPTQKLTVVDAKDGQLPWTATVPSGSWISLSQTSGLTPTDVTVTVNASGLSQGTYQDVITLKSTNAKNSPLSVPVTLRVGTGGACTHVSPLVSVAPAASQGVPAGTPVNFTISVTNKDVAPCTASNFSLQASVPSGWQLAFGATSLSIAPGATASTSLQITSPATAPNGAYTISGTAKHAANQSLSTPFSATYVVSNPGGGGTTGNFSDNFDRADSTNLGSAWSEIGGNLVISGNTLKNALQAGNHVAIVSALSGPTQTAGADFISVDNNLGPRFGIFLRYQDPQNYYLIYRQVGGSSRLIISRYFNGVEKILAFPSIGNPAKNVPFRLTGRATGSTLTLEFNGVTKATITDTTFSTGKVGILIGSGSSTMTQHLADNFTASVQ